MNESFRKQVLCEFPELASGYHLPVMAEVTAITDAPKKGGVNDNYRPRLAVDVVLLNHEYKHTDIVLSAVPVAIMGGGDERGFFALPKKNTVVELAWLNGLPERPFVRSILGDRQALPWLDTDSMSWQQSQEVKQSVDGAGNWTRKTYGDIDDSAHTIRQEATQLISNVSNDMKRVLEHSVEDIDGKKVIEAGAIHQLSTSVLNLLALGSINQVASEHITRSVSGDLLDKAEGSAIQNIGGDSIQAIAGNSKQEVEGDVSVLAKKIHIGSKNTNALQLLVDLMGEVSSALNAITTMTVTCSAPGSPSSPPINAAAFTATANKVGNLKSKLSAIVK